MTWNGTRRSLLQSLAAVAAVPNVALPGIPLNHRAVVKNGAALNAAAMYLLPLGSIRPTGWLRRELEAQAQGLSGHLDETWPDVGPQSGWKGGKGESWERGPYYVDGLLPLAHLLEDARLQQKAFAFVDWTLKSQRQDGEFGPDSGKEHWWPRMVMLKVLTQHYEATGDARVIPFMERYFAYQLKNLPGDPLKSWARARWQDNVLTIFWLYNRTGNKNLLALAKLLQSQGYDWTANYRNFKYTEKVTQEKFLAMRDVKPDGHHPVHGVDVGMGLKATAVWSQMPGAPDGNEAVQQWETLDKYHGMPTGIYSCDEVLAGTAPTQGTELCTVVECMFSLEQSLAVTGNGALGDRLEQIAYNALPGGISYDMWSHQYDQQPNQLECGLHTKPWTINGPEANVFGLEPNFGCCTANYHQGWPKLASSLWMATADDGLAACVYAPCVVQTAVRGRAVKVDVQTEYPFRNTVAIAITPEAAIEFPLLLRVPAYEEAPVVKVNGETQTLAVQHGFARITRRWNAGDVVTIAFAMKPRIVDGAQNSVSVHRGPLVFSLPIEEKWTMWRKRGLTADWFVYPQSAWNYALQVAERAHVEEGPIGFQPFARERVPVTVRMQGVEIENWQATDGVANTVPKQLKQGATKPLELVPYGATKLRITAFPKV